MPAQQLVERTREKIVNGLQQIPPNPSSQQLVKEPLPAYTVSTGGSVTRNRITVAVLVFVNLINYMDRLTIAGILTPIQEEFGANNAMMGLLQTAFILSYMIFAPLFGYLGDRYSRRNIMAFGVFLWSIFTLIGSLMYGTPENQEKGWANPDFWAFLGSRAMVGIGEASYSTVAPTLISDMFVKDARSQMLALFYFAIPVGSGLGYIVGSKTAEVAGTWQWGLRATPILGVLAVLMILFLLEDPPRGHSEGHGNAQAQTYMEDIRSLSKNMTFVFSTLAFTCVTFCTGALSWWGPDFIKKAVLTIPEEERVLEPGKVAIVFGAVTMMSGIIGVPLGMFLSTKLKVRYPRADPVICGMGILVSAVFLTMGMFLVKDHIILAFILLFLGEIALNLNWSIVADILLYVVAPACRGTAEAVQILTSHAFGDAGSPYLIGLIADGLKNFLDHSGQICLNTPAGDYGLNATLPADTETTPVMVLADATNNTIVSASLSAGGGSPTNITFENLNVGCLEVEYRSMLYSLLTNCGVELLGGLLFLLTAGFIIKDKMRCEQSAIGCRREGASEIKMMLPRASPEESLGEGDDEMPQLINKAGDEGSRSTTPV